MKRRDFLKAVFGVGAIATVVTQAKVGGSAQEFYGRSPGLEGLRADRSEYNRHFMEARRAWDHLMAGADYSDFTPRSQSDFFRKLESVAFDGTKVQYSVDYGRIWRPANP